MGDVSERVKRLRLKTGTAIDALALDLDLSASADPDDEETSGLLTADNFLASLSMRDRDRLRAVVKQVHLRHHPTEMITDREADRVIEAMGPITREKLIKKAIDHGMFS